MEILDQARKLGQMIAESEEMSLYKKAEATLAGDKTADNLLEDYKRLQVELVKATREKKEAGDIEAIRESLMATQQEINQNDITRSFLESKAGLEKLMKHVNDVIVYGITGDEGCSSDKCSSCSGCK